MEKTRFILFVLFCLSIESFASVSSPNIVECKAPTVSEFLREQTRNGFQNGLFSRSDFTTDKSCVFGSSLCEHRRYEDNGSPGYYEAHFVHTIIREGRVIFSETSAYAEGTYGGSLGVEDAEEKTNFIFMTLQSAGICQR